MTFILQSVNDPDYYEEAVSSSEQVALVKSYNMLKEEGYAPYIGIKELQSELTTLEAAKNSILEKQEVVIADLLNQA